MHPVAGTGNVDAVHLLKGAGPPILHGIIGPALGAAQEQCRAGNPLPDTARFFDIELIRRLRPHVIIEFPGIGPILITIRTMQRQVIRLLGRQALVRFLHALHCLIKAGIAAGMPTSIGAHLGDPLAHALIGRTASEVTWRWPKPLNRYESLGTLRIYSAVLTGNRST